MYINCNYLILNLVSILDLNIIVILPSFQSFELRNKIESIDIYINCYFLILNLASIFDRNNLYK